MKRIISYLFLITLSCLVLFPTGCGENENISPEIILSGEDDTEETVINETTFFQDTLFYYGTDNTEMITFNEQSNSYSMEAFEGHIMVFFKEGVNLQTAKNAISSQNGTIIEQIPYIGYYLVQVDAGKEANFIAKIRSKNVEFVGLDPVYALRSMQATPAIAHILDAFYSGELHGLQVQSVYNNCSKKISYGYNFGYKTKNGKNRIKGSNAINNIVKRYRADELYNLSFGPVLSQSNENLQWDQATDIQHNSYIVAQQYQIKHLVWQLNKLRKSGVKNTVVTMAAGNEGIPNFDELILNPMLNNKAGSYSLTNEEKDVLKNNVLIVSSLESASNNMKYFNNAMGRVDIDDLTYGGKKLHGTSFAAPKALCMVRKLMEEMNISAVAALAAMKQAIRNNPYSMLVYDEALKQAQTLYNTEIYETTWGFELTSTAKGKSFVSCVMKAGGVAQIGTDISGTWSINNNLLTVNWVANEQRPPGCTYQLKGIIKDAACSGTYTHWDYDEKGTQSVYDSGTFTGYISSVD